MNQYNLTMEQITAYRTWLSGEEKSAGTIEKYLRDIGAFARWLKGAPVSKDRTSEWKTHLLAQGYAPVTINSMLAALNGLFHFWGGTSAGPSFCAFKGGCSGKSAGS
ncbi:MAG: site-specific integrase [Evtepia gabavorous]